MDLYPEMEAYAHGMLGLTGGDLLYWEVCGKPNGKPALVLHGGPGSGCTPWHRRLFHRAKYRIIPSERASARATPRALIAQIPPDAEGRKGC
jgi:proline iminopeptidase